MVSKECWCRIFLSIWLLAVIVASEEQGRAKVQGRAVGTLSAFTAVTVTSTTTTKWLSCAEGAALACKKRRRRRGTFELDLNSGIQANLESSLNEEVPVKEALESDRSQRIAYTIWYSTTSTYTLTSTSTNSATTITVSYSCSVPGVYFPPACPAPAPAP